MQLFINNETVDFTIEHEKTLKEAVQAVETWLAGQKLLISSLQVNGESYTQETLEKNGALPLEKIATLHVTACDFMQFEQLQIDLLTKYFGELKNAVLDSNRSALPPLLDRFAARISALQMLFPRANDQRQSGIQAEIDKLFTGTTPDMILLWDEDTKNKAAALCDSLLEEMAQRRAAYEHLDKSSLKVIRETIAKLRETVARLREVSVLLQTGKDSQAMQTIISFSELTQLFFQLAANHIKPGDSMSFAADGDNFETFSAKLNTHLRELIDAFQKKDFILIGDLCEYEIAPKISVLVDFFEKTITTA